MKSLGYFLGALCVVFVAFGFSGSIGPAQATAAEPQAATRFVAIDLVLDAKGEPLGAWQIELTDRAGIAKLTGVEGGDFEGFKEAPTYDPRALQSGFVKLAAFHLLPDGPRARTRVATLHFLIEGANEPDFHATLIAAATPSGAALQPQVSIEQ